MEKTKTKNSAKPTSSNVKSTSKHDGLKSVQNSAWFPFIVFLIGTFVIGVVAYFMGGQIGRPSGNIPLGTLSNLAFYIIWPLALLSIALATYFQWLSKKTRPIVEIRENLITFYIHMAVMLFWPLLFFRVYVPIVAVVFLGIAILLGIYLVYRYFNSCITAGILSLIWVLWLLYVFYFNFSYVLIN